MRIGDPSREKNPLYQASPLLAVIAAVVVLALLALLIATDEGPDAADFTAEKDRNS